MGIFSLLQKTNNGFVLRLLELFRHRSRALPAPQKDGREAMFSALLPAPGFIEDQHRYGGLRYGASDMGKAGCEVIAVYNALYSLTGGQPYTLPQLMARFEQDGMLLRGHFGTSPRAMADFLRKQGYSVQLCTRAAEFDTVAGGARCLILTFYNDMLDIREEIHTVCVTGVPGGYTAHNLSCDGRVCPVYPTISALCSGINGGRAKAIALVTIQ